MSIELQIQAYEGSIDKKTKELEEMQKNNVKFQRQQGLKEEIYRLKRQILQLKNKH